ncbi:MAG: hypothetical protein JWO87_1743 [Phycisphaerales bacterium]|nr:hypothetical protein [Phycisphaerales bacterium]
MAPGILKQALAQRPFRPIRIFTGDGTTFDIKSQEFCVLSPKGRTLVVFNGEGGESGDDEEMRLVDVFLITKLETAGRSDSFKFVQGSQGEQDA